MKRWLEWDLNIYIFYVFIQNVSHLFFLVDSEHRLQKSKQRRLKSKMEKRPSCFLYQSHHRWGRACWGSWLFCTSSSHLSHPLNRVFLLLQPQTHWKLTAQTSCFFPSRSSYRLIVHVTYPVASMKASPRWLKRTNNFLFSITHDEKIYQLRSFRKTFTDEIYPITEWITT